MPPSLEYDVDWATARDANKKHDWIMVMKSVGKVLIANRGEIAIRIAKTLRRLGLGSVMIGSADDGEALHFRSGDRAVELEGRGATAYLDGARIIEAATETGCEAIHPGYGFLSESGAFASACAEAGLLFVGPSADTLHLFGDKAKARLVAQRVNVPVLPGVDRAVTVQDVHEFFAANGARPIVIKAVAGGGGRGMRIARSATELDRAYDVCVKEALAAFGHGEVLVELFLAQARHVEVQIVGDGEWCSHLWERDCTLQRRGQKLIEIAPAPDLDSGLREKLWAAAVELGRASGYRGIGTVEFLVETGPEGCFWFLEANPRLQVEHTVTEQITGLDLVEIQLALAQGRKLAELGLEDPESHPARGMAMQLRINLEDMDSAGQVTPSVGTLDTYVPPEGPDIRVDGQGFPGFRSNPAFDSLLAKLVIGPLEGGLGALIPAARNALNAFVVEGVTTNIALLRVLLDLPELGGYRLHTRFFEERLADLVAALPVYDTGSSTHGDDEAVIRAAMAGQVVEVLAAPGEALPAGAEIMVLEAMKMQHDLVMRRPGVIASIDVAPGDNVSTGQVVATFEPDATIGSDKLVLAKPDIEPGAIGADLQAFYDRLATTHDENRTEAVARRRERGQRTARENVSDLCDPGSFEEYGALALAGQRQRRSEEELIRISPADGLITGIGTVNASLFGETRTRTAIMAYDATVFAGTQGFVNHFKTDRLLDLACEHRLPFVLYGEGGGGRPGETDYANVGGLQLTTFEKLGKLSGRAPSVAMVSGRCFAGNAALVGGCDIVVAARDANIGMAGPAMIEGGGLGVVSPGEIGPIEAQAANGLVHVAVANEAEGTAVVRKLLGYYQGRAEAWEVTDQTAMRDVIPANRRKSYSVRSVIEILSDTGTFIELRPSFGTAVVTGFARIEGRPVGVMASDPQHMGGAIDVDAAQKMTDFLSLCDSWQLPILSLIDTPGFMVGTEIEKLGMVRSAAAIFKASARIEVPVFGLVLRRSFGLGAMAYMGGHTRAPVSCVSWPQGEFGGMGLEGYVRLAYRRELEAIDDPSERNAEFDRLLAGLRKRGGAVSAASYFEIDGVIDPAETRAWLLRGLKTAGGGA